MVCFPVPEHCQGVYHYVDICYNNWAISRALIGRELWSIRVQTIEMTWWLRNLFSLFNGLYSYPLASGWWFHLSFEHFDVFSIVEWNIVVYLLINVNNLINKNSQSTIFRSGTLIGHLSSKTPHFQNEAKCTTLLAKMSFISMRMKNANNSFSP